MISFPRIVSNQNFQAFLASQVLSVQVVAISPISKNPNSLKKGLISHSRYFVNILVCIFSLIQREREEILRAAITCKLHKDQCTYLKNICNCNHVYLIVFMYSVFSLNIEYKGRPVHLHIRRNLWRLRPFVGVVKVNGKSSVTGGIIWMKTLFSWFTSDVDFDVARLWPHCNEGSALAVLRETLTLQLLGTFPLVTLVLWGRTDKKRKQNSWKMRNAVLIQSTFSFHFWIKQFVKNSSFQTSRCTSWCPNLVFPERWILF